MAQAGTPVGIRRGHRPGLRHAREGRLRGPLRLRGHRQRDEPGLTPLRRSEAGTDLDQPEGLCFRGGPGRGGGRERPDAQRFRAARRRLQCRGPPGRRRGLMPRDIPVGNGSLLVNFDQTYQLRDLYWPHVGQEDHSPGHPFRFGVWVDGQFRWIDHPGWQRTLDYASDTLVTQVSLYHPELGVRLMCNDAVDFHENLYLRRLAVTNEADREREVRLFFCQDFHISGTEVGDSAYYEPERRAVFHYKGKRWFMINVARAAADGWDLGVDQWAVGIKEFQGRGGAWARRRGRPSLRQRRGAGERGLGGGAAPAGAGARPGRRLVLDRRGGQ